MAKQKDISKKATQNGERTAISGYEKQFDEFTRRVYECMHNGTLVKIRVAFGAQNVGILDDIWYETIKEVHAYQIKTSSIDKPFGYAEYAKLLPQIVAGWLLNKQQYPIKTVIPHLWTDRAIAATSPVGPKGGKKIDDFPNFLNEVASKLKEGETVDAKWESIIRAIKAAIKKEIGREITSEEWNSFWKIFDFATNCDLEMFTIADTQEQKIIDWGKLESIIIKMAAGKDENEKTCAKLFKNLFWNDRVYPKFEHDLKVDEATFVPIEGVLNQLSAQLMSKTKGYIFLEGTPGSGKSTILTKWAQSIPNTTIPYYAFDFTKPSRQYRNNFKRGEALQFLYDIVKMLRARGYKTESEVLPYRDEAFLQKEFNDLLNQLSEECKATKKQVIIIVDGLDHVHREYTRIHGDSLLNVLPTVDDLPEGVLFVLGSQYYETLGLDGYIRAEYRNKANVVTMPSFTREEIEALVKKVLGEEKATKKFVDGVAKKSLGNPLYLHYILKQIKANPSKKIEQIPAYEKDIEIYYEKIAKQVLDDLDNRDFLALLSRMAGDIKDDFIREWKVPMATLRAVLKEMGYLFVHDKTSKTRSFFHNSFRQYLLRETTYDFISEDYSERISEEYYQQLAEYIKASKVENQWNAGTYLSIAETTDEDSMAMFTPEKLTEQIHHFRPLWHVQRDIEYVAQTAAKEQDAYTLAGMLLLQHQIERMRVQETDGTVLIEDFLKLGEGKLAKQQIQDEGEIYVKKEDALQLARLFYKYNDQQEATFLYESSKPEALQSLPEGHYYRREQILKDHVDKVIEWVRTAVYFIDVFKIEEQIANYVTQLQEVTAGEDGIDVGNILFKLKYQVVLSLVERDQYDELEKYIATYPKAKQAEMRFRIQREKLQHMLQKTEDPKSLQAEYVKLQQALEDVTLTMPDKIYLEMAGLAQRVGRGKEMVAQYLAKVRWDKLDSISRRDRSMEKFSRYDQRIRYVELRTYLGNDDDLHELVPNSSSTEEHTLKEYERMIYHLAQLRGKAHREGQTDAEFLSNIKSYMKFFEVHQDMTVDYYAYMYGQQRGDFNAYMVLVASAYGKETVRKMHAIVDALWTSGDLMAKSGDLRKLAMDLYKAGVGKSWAVSILEQIEEGMMQNKDVYERQIEALEHGRAWEELNEKEKAMKWFERMIVESFGLDYRKDPVPATMSEWISEANQADSAHAVERIHWMTSRLKAMTETCVDRTAHIAGKNLFGGALAVNLGMGEQLGEWLYQCHYGSFEALSSVLVRMMLERTQTEEEYKVIFHYFTQVHLAVMEGDPYTETRLLEPLYRKGMELLGGSFGEYVKELRNYILTECPHDARATMIAKLDELEHPKQEVVKEKSEYDRLIRESDELLEKAEELLEQGKRTEAWTMGMEALRKSQSFGWDRFYDGGSRLNACAFLQQIDKTAGQQIAFQQLADDITHGGYWGATGNMREMMDLLVDDLDVLKLFDVELGYMNRIMREDTENEYDKPTLTFTDDGVRETIMKWLKLARHEYKNGVYKKAEYLAKELAEIDNDKY